MWARQLVLVFGNTSQAVSTILTGFFGGLAIGGVLRRPDRGPRRAAAPAVRRRWSSSSSSSCCSRRSRSASSARVYQGIYPSLAESPVALALVRFALAILALAPATLLMGATLPTLTRFLTKGGAGIAGAFQKLYAANTLGAIFGTAIAGFVLIELFGLTGALARRRRVLGDGRPHRAAPRPRAAGVGGRRRRRPTRNRSAESCGHDPLPDRGRPSRRAGRLALLLAFVSGLTSLGYQVVWNRLIGAGTGSSTYVFTIILTLFLIGIALGAVMLGVLRLRVALDDRPDRRRPAADRAVRDGRRGDPRLAAGPVQRRRRRTSSTALRGFAWQATLLVLPPTIAMGITFPATAALLGEETRLRGRRPRAPCSRSTPPARSSRRSCCRSSSSR